MSEDKFMATNAAEINYICKKYRITNYTINNDMSVDINSDFRFRIKPKRTGRLPLNFNRINGSFNCNNLGLTTLFGTPEYVYGYFDCGYNNLQSLEYLSKFIIGDFYCNDNKLTNIKNNSTITGSIRCYSNNLRTLENINYEDIRPFQSQNFFNKNPIEEIWKLFKNKKYIEHFNELDIIRDNGKTVILERLNYFLQDLGKDEVTSLKNYKTI